MPDYGKYPVYVDYAWNPMVNVNQPGESQVYEFRAMQYGTSWYHGHFSLQCK